MAGEASVAASTVSPVTSARRTKVLNGRRGISELLVVDNKTLNKNEELKCYRHAGARSAVEYPANAGFRQKVRAANLPAVPTPIRRVHAPARSGVSYASPVPLRPARHRRGARCPNRP